MPTLLSLDWRSAGAREGWIQPRVGGSSGGGARRSGVVENGLAWPVDGLVGLIHGVFFFFFIFLINQGGHGNPSVNAMINHGDCSEVVGPDRLEKSFLTALENHFCSSVPILFLLPLFMQ